MLVALIVSAVILLILRVNPFTAYSAMFRGAFGSMNGWYQSLVKATPPLLVSPDICIAFKASVINIGGEGQIIMGALAGAFWGFIPGYLKAR